MNAHIIPLSPCKPRAASCAKSSESLPLAKTSTRLRNSLWDDQFIHGNFAYPYSAQENSHPFVETHIPCISSPTGPALYHSVTLYPLMWLKLNKCHSFSDTVHAEWSVLYTYVDLSNWHEKQSYDTCSRWTLSDSIIVMTSLINSHLRIKNILLYGMKVLRTMLKKMPTGTNYIQRILHNFSKYFNLSDLQTKHCTFSLLNVIN